MSGYFDAKEIVPRIWIGSRADALNPEFMQKHSIGMIVNCTRDVAMPFSRSILSIRIPVDDHPNYNDVFCKYIRPAISKMHMFLRRTRGRNILVHCAAGISRSASTVAAFLMSEYRIPASKSIQFIQSRKPETFHGGVNFRHMLEYVEMSME
jgi:protein tyrosine phosphatase